VAREVAASYHTFLLRASNYKATGARALYEYNKIFRANAAMTVLRNALLAASRSTWLAERAPRSRFVRRTASRFMPGESSEDALEAARRLTAHGIGSVFTYLGENVTDAQEAAGVAQQYGALLDQMRSRRLETQLSVKLTQLGVDLSSAQCYGNLIRILDRAGPERLIWIDMESSKYTDITLELFRRARRVYPNVGVCLQAYLHRTARDIAALLPVGPAIRLVKGAYEEPSSIAFHNKKDVDHNFFALLRTLLGKPARHAGVRTAIATHDPTLIQQAIGLATATNIPKDQFEFQTLYGIQGHEIVRLVRDGYRARVLIAYGSQWFPWFMRRLAERPANALHLLRHMLVR
jgi:proline dehydrogenase